MSLKSDRARLEYALKMIDDIRVITARHGGVSNTLSDVEGHHALLMCCMQLGETLNKIESQDLRAALPVDAAYGLRNIIAHDYLGISKEVIEDTINVDVPVLKAALEKLLG